MLIGSERLRNVKCISANELRIYLGKSDSFVWRLINHARKTGVLDIEPPHQGRATFLSRNDVEVLLGLHSLLKEKGKQAKAERMERRWQKGVYKEVPGKVSKAHECGSYDHIYRMRKNRR